eukprot:CAMPEP_0119013806 /NCGR_PEP_ID=MMETSP1176-20130426/9007_1 /TAXON_ID=265551 /ORGANISM="Synedropsis recta cf, Strain CCMP1620" /LENGTH=172 /DNA_ID=CAMNT_0006966925 /DNA_START=35 /DNA_END=553 /DNA_ORIENTATION=+
MKKLVLLLAFVAPTFAFLAGGNFGHSYYAATSMAARSCRTNTRLYLLGPISKMAQGKEYKKVVETYMKEKGLTRAEAEKEYDKYLENPNDFMLSKRADYYISLGYKGFEDGVIGEAEKEGRGDEMREKMADFKRESKIKGFTVIGTFIALFAYLKVTHDADPVAFEQMLHSL